MLVNLCVGISPTLHSLNHPDPTTTILAFCKLRIYLLQSSSMMYRWALSMACLDRFALSSVNVRLRRWSTVDVARRAVVGILCIWLVLPIHGLIFYHLKQGGCGIYENQAAALYHSTFTTLFGSVMCVTIMITCAILIYRNLRLRHKRRIIARQSVRTQREVERSQRSRDQQVFLMLILQVVVYVLTITPLMMMYFYNAFTMHGVNKSADDLLVKQFAFYLVEVIIFLFPALSFYLHTMISKMFRKELRRLLHPILCCQCRPATHRIEPVSRELQARRHLDTSLT
jgi:hypothetical protein